LVLKLSCLLTVLCCAVLWPSGSCCQGAWACWAWAWGWARTHSAGKGGGGARTRSTAGTV